MGGVRYGGLGSRGGFRADAVLFRFRGIGSRYWFLRHEAPLQYDPRVECVLAGARGWLGDCGLSQMSARMMCPFFPAGQCRPTLRIGLEDSVVTVRSGQSDETGEQASSADGESAPRDPVRRSEMGFRN